MDIPRGKEWEKAKKTGQQSADTYKTYGQDWHNDRFNDSVKAQFEKNPHAKKNPDANIDVKASEAVLRTNKADPKLLRNTVKNQSPYVKKEQKKDADKKLSPEALKQRQKQYTKYSANVVGRAKSNIDNNQPRDQRENVKRGHEQHRNPESAIKQGAKAQAKSQPKPESKQPSKDQQQAAAWQAYQAHHRSR